MWCSTALSRRPVLLQAVMRQSRRVRAGQERADFLYTPRASSGQVKQAPKGDANAPWRGAGRKLSAPPQWASQDIEPQRSFCPLLSCLRRCCSSIVFWFSMAVCYLDVIPRRRRRRDPSSIVHSDIVSPDLHNFIERTRMDPARHTVPRLLTSPCAVDHRP